MQTVKLIVYLVSAILITIFVSQNLNGMTNIIFLYWDYEIETVLLIIFTMLFGAILMLPLFIKGKIEQKRKKKKVKISKQSQEESDLKLPEIFDDSKK